MKVVFDANVIIAAYASPAGVCASLFQFCLENHTLILSESLLKEVSSNLHKKIKVPPSLLNEIIKSLHKEYIIPSYEMLDIKTCRDPNDVHVLSMAFAAGAQYIVSGDQDLLCLKQFRLIPILTPREFWNVLRLG